MAVVKFINNGGFSDFAGGTVVTSLETQYVYTSTSGKTITLLGTDLYYDAQGVLFFGTISSVKMTTGSTVNLTITGLSFSAQEFSELALGLFTAQATIAPDTHALEISMLSGTDTLYDGAGNADMYGREGNDVLRAGDGHDWLYGGQGVDRYFGDAGYDFVSFWDGAQGVNIDLTRISGQVRDDGFGNIETAAGVEGWDGSDFGDTMLGGAAAVTFYGQNGNDSLTGGAGDDSIWGGDGVDSLQGGAGSNTLDLWVNGAGHAVSVDLRKVTGQILDDGYGNIETATGFQEIWGSRYGDRLIGNNSSNTIVSGDGTDYLFGFGGDDTLYGGSGIDSLYGGTGSDHLHGKEGRNILVGGADADYFYFADHISDIGGLRQTVTDFVHGVDHILLDSDLGGFNALGAVAASQFRSGAGFTTASTADQRLIYNTINGLLYLDVDGLGGVAAVQIGRFSNLPTLTAADFQIEYQP